MPENPTSPVRPGQERFVAPPDEVQVLATDKVDDTESPTSIWTDAWRSLRRKPMFLVASALILFILVVVFFPSLFTSQDPHYCNTEFSMQGPSGSHPFGFDLQGCDIYARTIYGAKASVFAGIGATVLFVLIGGTVGALAGFYGGWLDSIVSRVSEIVYSIPLMLAAIVLMQLMKERTLFTVIVVLAAFTWPQAARIMRGAVLEAKGADYVTASKALGVSRFKTLLRHVLPNSISPLIVVATIWLGAFIVTEATLSFLGVGLPATTVSWGGDIATGQKQLRGGSPILFYPATALAITVLSFMMLGDAVRDALDPKQRGRS